jgi:hypothetical protein
MAIDCDKNKGICTVELPQSEDVENFAAKYNYNVQLVTSGGKQVVVVTEDSEDPVNIVSFVTKDHVYIVKFEFNSSGSQYIILKNWRNNAVQLAINGH